MRNKRNATIAAVISLVVLVAGLWLILRDIGTPDKPLNTLAPAGRQNWEIFGLVMPVFAVAGLVEVGVIWMVTRFKRRREDVDGVDEPTQTHGNTPLEITWTAIPALMLAVLAVFNVQTLLSLEESEDPIEVRVIGQQWWWEYRYDTDRDGEVDIITATQLVIPVGRDVELKIQSNDVIHSFWIPAINGKKDAVPGRTHTLVMTAEKPGIYQGQCTEFCGLSHGVMRMELKALPEAEYEEWVEQMTAPPEQPTDAKALAGQELFVAQCARCHQVNGLTPDSQAPYTYAELPNPEYGEAVDSPLLARNAPNLTKLMMRQTFAGSLLPLYEGEAATAVTAVPDGTPATSKLKEWLRDPEAIKPMNPENGQGMPNLQLSEEQIDQLVAYLVTLK
jgi:cytochrome c oxidase subunit 2